jgi:hypothetical protein
MGAVGDRQTERRKRDEKRRAEVMALPTLPVRQHSAITADDAGEVLVTTSIGPNGQAIALWTSPDDRGALAATTTQPGGATFPDPRASRPVTVRVTIQKPGKKTSLTIADFPLAHSTVQVLPDERVLAVAARCRWRPDGPDHNAIIYDPDGRAIVEGTVGDGVHHVFVSDSGHVWVGYFDEGVYGNNGWGDAGSPPPLGAPGLVRYSPDLEPDWHYPADARQSWGAISDCYALNIDGDTAWACYYTDFPVVRIEAGTVTGWRNSIARGVHALAIADETIAMCGGYGPNHDVLTIAGRDQDQLHKLAEYRLVLADGSPLPDATRAIGRGADLHLINRGEWHRLDLDDLPQR